MNAPRSVGYIMFARALDTYSPTERERIADVLSALAADILKGQTGVADEPVFHYLYITPDDDGGHP